jgi:glyoxylase-like metal-dependent hydrolase (beta-lactamase superfamily II)
VRIDDLQIETIESQPFAENTYVAHVRGRAACLVVDPGFEPDRIVDFLVDNDLVPAAILITHGHSDHIAGNEVMKQNWPACPLIVGVGDAPKLTDPVQNLSAPFGVRLVSPPADVLVRENDVYSAAGVDLEILETPGHSAGHVVFVRKSQPWVVFGGDVLFRGSIGRTDFPDGDFDQLASAIHQKLFTMPADTIVLPGHGPITTIGHERLTNPFVGAPAGYMINPP